jgi:hypothetical protein
MASPEQFSPERNLVACPYFMPLQKLENGSWPHPARLPLGCGWSGHCTAPGHEGQVPSQDVLESSCNLGYANSCPWAPSQRIWDSVRFAVSAPLDSGVLTQNATDDARARILRLVYACERDHLPVATGELAYDLSRAAWLSQHEDPRVQRMAECFLDSYMKKKA